MRSRDGGGGWGESKMDCVDASLSVCWKFPECFDLILEGREGLKEIDQFLTCTLHVHSYTE